MENTEEIFNYLEEFSKRKLKVIPQELNEYLAYVANTGDPVYQWPQIKCLFREKLLNVITDFHDSNPGVDIPPCPNVDPFNYQSMKNSLLERLDSFTSAPFTVQRLCELLTHPRKQYNRVDKFMRAIEKNILVVSTREPGFRFLDDNGDSSDTVILNGSDNSDYHLDVEMEDVSWKERENKHSEPQPSSSSAHSSSNKDSKHPSKHHRDSKDSAKVTPSKIHFQSKIVRDHKRIERMHLNHDSPRRDTKKGDKSIDVSTIPLPGTIPSMSPADEEMKLEPVKKPAPVPEVKLERLEHTKKKPKDETKEIKIEGENIKKEKETKEGELKEVHKKDEFKKEELIKVELKTDELKKEQLKKEELKKEQLKKEELKKEQLIKEEFKKEQLKKEELKKEQLKKEELKKEQLKKEDLKKEQLKKEEHKKEELKKEELKKEELKKEELEKDELEKDELEKEELKEEELKKEELKEEELKKEQIKTQEEVEENETKREEKEDAKEKEEDKMQCDSHSKLEMSEDDSIDESSSDSNSKEDTEMKMISEASTSSEESSSSEGSSPKTDNEAQVVQEDEKQEVLVDKKEESDPLKETPQMEPIKPKPSLPVSIETDKYTISDVKSELAHPLPSPPQEKVAPENNEEENKQVNKITEAGDSELMETEPKPASPVISEEKKEV